MHPTSVAKALFADPPDLLSVATPLVQGVLDQHYGEFDLSAERVRLAVPYWVLAQGIDGAPAGHNHYSLAEVMLERFALRAPVWGASRSPRGETHNLLWRDRPPAATKPLAIDLDGLLKRLDQAARALLLENLKQQLIERWNQSPQGHGPSRWARLAAAIGRLLVAGQMPGRGGLPDLSRLPFYMGYSPDDAQGKSPPLDIRAFETRVFSVDEQGRRYPELYPVIDFRRYDERLQRLPYPLYFHPGEGGLRSGKLDSAELVAMLIGSRTAGRSLEVSESLVWRWNEPAEVIGDSLAKGLLEYQLQALSALPPGDLHGRAHLQRWVDEITDPGQWFAVPARISDTGRFQVLRQERCGAAALGMSSTSLPDWLLGASIADRASYSHLLTELARTQCESAGRHFLEGIGTLDEFATRRLQALMHKDHPTAAAIDPHTIKLNIDKLDYSSTQTLDPQQAQVTVAVDMTLVELALANLGGMRHTGMRIRIEVRGLAQPVPDWMAPDYLRGLVTRADIGQAYPDLLKARLLTDAAEARRREALFVAQWRVRLPLQALELKIRDESGVSVDGFRHVQALVQPAAPGRRVDGMEIVLRPLAFKARADWRADAVQAMFVIGPRDMSRGPLLLFRPLFLQQPLRQFATAQALLDAIRQPGDLQRSVLTWMSETARQRYDHGGFDAPHIQQFLPGDEFAPAPAKPVPAMLGEETVEGDYLSAIFAAMVRAQVEQADRQSVSNAEQRWADWKQGAWQVLLSITQLPFAGLLPYVGRLVEVLGWLVTLEIGHDDLRALDSDNRLEQSAGAADLLFNLAALLLHYRVDSFSGETAVPPLRPLEPPPAAVLPAPTIAGVPDLPRVELSAWSMSGWPVPEALMKRVRPYRLRAFGKPASALTELGRVADSGPARGLVHIEEAGKGRWCALLHGDLYEVAWEAEAHGVRIIDDQGNAGPWVRSDEQGRWSLDMRLRGGSPPKRVRAGGSQTVIEGRAELVELNQQIKVSEPSVSNSVKRWKLATEGETAKRVTYERRTELLGEMTTLLEANLQNYSRQLELSRRLMADPRLTKVVRPFQINALENGVIELQTLLHAQQTWLLERFEQPHSTLSQQAEQQMDPVLVQAEWERDAAAADQSLDWALQQQDWLEQLRQIRDGRESYQKVIATVGWGSIEVEVRACKIAQLKNRFALGEITPEELGQEMFDAIWDQFERLHVSYYSSLDALVDGKLSAGERIELLESVVEQSGDLQEKLGFYLATLVSRGLPTEKLDRVIASLTAIAQDTGEDLRRLLGIDDWELPPEPVAAPSTEKTRRKVIRTRHQQLFSGEVLAPTSADGEETVQVSDVYGRVIETFRQNTTDGLWEPLVAPQVPGKPAPIRPLVGLETRVSSARRLLNDESSAIERVMKQAGRSNAPRAQEDILRLQAEAMEHQASEIDTLLGVAQTPPRNPDRVRNAQAVVRQLREAAPRLLAAGQRARIAAIKANPPEMPRVDYLLTLGEVSLRKEGERVQLGKHDFLQEYVLLDQDGKPLWYAHFHYASLLALDTAFEAAHLKTAGQRKLGGNYQSLEQERAFKKIQTGQGGNANLALQIYRGRIDLAAAQQHFFPG
ncbi:hypothetical protein [Pseudomonas gingeri]|uniref:Uncharacterized protein n=1 Tax=Pseudomonas gingeri TaxID=117681 RepID=A0A7Y7YBD6_9PSED|nr:hypothetical protein [Pseudomonas gingeri]NWB29829.1 hypothetical protein [Pseudomonas gingeri]NWC31965.1 hypothetical protein [Pseudomonas gingeri]NWD48555.1 hypothetical protein [Pseudomonas gingeri]